MSVAFFEPARHMDVAYLMRQLHNETVVYTKDPKCTTARKKHTSTAPFTCYADAKRCHVLGSWRRDISTGMEAAIFAFQKLPCGSLTLFGFNTSENEGQPYHYWRDGSVHDHKTGGDWYKSRAVRGGGHNFRAEHRLLQTLSSPTGVVQRRTYEDVCTLRTPAFRRVNAIPTATVTRRIAH
jgi:hypothetical protein